MTKNKYIDKINGINLFEANAVTCAYLIADIDIEKIHPNIIKKVREWQDKQKDNRVYWSNPLHC